MTCLSILILSQNNLACADVLPEFMKINKGTPAPYEGILITVDRFTDLYKQFQQCEVQKQVNISLLKSLSLMQENEDIYKNEIIELKDQNVKLDTALVKANSNGFWNKAMWLGIGVISTGLIVYAARK